MMQQKDIEELTGLLHRLADLHLEYAELCEQEAADIYYQLLALQAI
jgi:hypothetical protein